MKQHSTTSTLRLGLVLLLALALPSVMHAASFTWGTAGAGGTGNWDANTTANWFDGAADVVWPAAPGSGNDDAVFGGTAGTVTIAPGGVIANDLTFNVDGYTVQGDTLTLDASLAKPILMSPPATTTTISAVIAGTNGFNKYDSGTLILTGSNTFYGNVQLGVPDLGGPACGVLRITKAAALGVRGNVVQADGSTNQLIIIRADGTWLELDGSGGDITIPGHVGFLTSGPNCVLRNVAGSNTVNSGFVLTTGVSDTRINSDGGSLTLAGPIHVASSARQIILGGTNSAVNTVSGVIADASNGALTGLKKSGPNTWLITGTNTYGGQTVFGTLNGVDGILRLGNSSALGTSNLLVTGGSQSGRVEFFGDITITNAITMQGRSSGNTRALSSLSGSNTLTGNITGVVGSGGAFNIESQAGFLTVQGGFSQTYSAGRGVYLLGAGNGLFSGNIVNGSGTLLTKRGAGTWTISGTNSYADPTTVEAGRLQFARQVSLYSNAPVSWTATNLTVWSNAVAAFNVGGAGEFTSSDIATLTALGSPTNGFLSGAILGLDTSGATSDFIHGSNLVNPNSTNILSLVKFGVNRLVLSGNNSYSGGTTVSGGTLVAASTSAFGAAGRTVTFNNGTIVDFVTDTSANAYVLNVGSGNTGTVLVDRATSGAAIAQGMGTATIGNSTLNVQAGVNVTSGTPTLQFTGIQLTAGGAGLGTATLNPTTANISIIGSVGRPGVAANSLTLGGTSAGNIISGSVTNGASALSVVKTNSSTWTLSGNNSYTGPTVISQGILNLMGSLTNSAVTNNGGTLSGTGVINGPVVINSGTLQPGVSTNLSETLTINNNLVLAGTALIQIGKVGATPVNDSVVGVTNINYGGTLIVTNATGATIVAGDAFVLFSASGTKAGNFTNIVVQPPVLGLTNTFNPVTGTLTFSSTVVAPPTLTFTNAGGGSLQFSWTGSFKLQSQTNTLSTGLGTNWGDYPSGGTSPVSVTVNPAKGSVFFRLSQ